MHLEYYILQLNIFPHNVEFSSSFLKLINTYMDLYGYWIPPPPPPPPPSPFLYFLLHLDIEKCERAFCWYSESKWFCETLQSSQGSSLQLCRGQISNPWITNCGLILPFHRSVQAIAIFCKIYKSKLFLSLEFLFST